jgi:hypothetical protein
VVPRRFAASVVVMKSVIVIRFTSSHMRCENDKKIW